MTDSVCVIIATIGKDSLERAIDSLYRQTYRRGPGGLQCLVVVDGPEFDHNARAVYHDAIRKRDADWINIITLPENTGAKGYRCFRIYGAMPMLVNQDWIAYLDDDNWFEPDHIANCVEACRRAPLDWCFTLRNIWHEGKLLCPDHCESVGLWPTWYDRSKRHIDTNCYFMRRELAVSVAQFWHRSRYDDKGEVQESADTIVANVLTAEEPRHALIAKPTVNYDLGSWELTAKPEFFTIGNEKFLEQHGGKLPWEASE